jgi:hypothetical protein
MAFPLNEIVRENRQRSRHQAISGAAGAPDNRGLSLYGCVVAGGGHRGHRLLPSASCRRPARPGREVRVAVSVSNCEEPGSGAGMRRRTARRTGSAGPMRAKALASATPGDIIPDAGGVPRIPGHDAGELRGNGGLPASRSSSAGRQLAVCHRGRQDLPGARFRPQPQPAAGLAHQPRAGNVSDRSPALTDPAHHNVPFQAFDALDAPEPFCSD